MVAERWSWKHPGELQQAEGLIPEHWGLSAILHTTLKEQHTKQERKQQLNNNKWTSRRSLDPKTLGELQQTPQSNNGSIIKGTTRGPDRHWHQHTDSNSSPQHTMATIPHLKGGNTNSQPTWAYKTHSTLTCFDVHHQQHNDSQEQT